MKEKEQEKWSELIGFVRWQIDEAIKTKKIPDELWTLFTLMNLMNVRRTQVDIPMPTDVFDAWNLSTVQVAFEAVALRRIGDGTPEGDIQVYLVERPPADPNYPPDAQGRPQLYCPGTILRPRERWRSAANRLAKREFGTEIVAFTLLPPQNYWDERRGHMLSVPALVELEGAPFFAIDNGRWMSCQHLGNENVMAHHRWLVETAMRTKFGSEPFTDRRHPLNDAAALEAVVQRRLDTQHTSPSSSSKQKRRGKSGASGDSKGIDAIGFMQGFLTGMEGRKL